MKPISFTLGRHRITIEPQQQYTDDKSCNVYDLKAGDAALKMYRDSIKATAYAGYVDLKPRTLHEHAKRAHTALQIAVHHLDCIIRDTTPKAG